NQANQGFPCQWFWPDAGRGMMKTSVRQPQAAQRLAGGIPNWPQKRTFYGDIEYRYITGRLGTRAATRVNARSVVPDCRHGRAADGQGYIRARRHFAIRPASAAADCFASKQRRPAMAPAVRQVGCAVTRMEPVIAGVE